MMSQQRSHGTNQHFMNSVNFVICFTICAFVLVALGACSPRHKSPGDAPHTGNPEIETQLAPDPALPNETAKPEDATPSESPSTTPAEPPTGEASSTEASHATPEPNDAVKDKTTEKTTDKVTNNEPDQTTHQTTHQPIDRPTDSDALQPDDELLPPIAEKSPTPAVVVEPDADSDTTAYVYSERIRARSSAEIKGDNIVGILELNDPVEIVDAKAEGGFVQVRIVKARGTLTVGQIVFVASKYLNKTPRVLSKDEEAAQDVFMVQNIATEKARIYKRCKPDEGCINRLLAEINTVNGEDQDGTRTSLGYYRITKWEKFYEDKARVYPAWYRPQYPPVPAANASRTEWFDDDRMPNGRGDARGAFGWYTAIVGPNSGSQWTHGTLGWGADGEAFIDYKNTFWGKLLNLFTSIRSHGCTRMSNPAVAYVREILPVGAALIKIYARETYRDETRTAYQAAKDERKWYYYILTTTGYGKAGGLGPDRYKVLASDTPHSAWLEEGAYLLDQYPSAKDRNLYDVDDDEFSGTYMVDEGTVSRDYRHPRELGRGGYSDQFLPAYMIAK